GGRTGAHGRKGRVTGKPEPGGARVAARSPGWRVDSQKLQRFDYRLQRRRISSLLAMGPSPIPTCPAKPVHWEFVLSQDEPRQWSWRCIAVDGSIDLHSEAYTTYESSVDNASTNGFRPADYRCSADTDMWTARIQKTKPPTCIGEDGSVATVRRRAHRAPSDAEDSSRRQAEAAPVALAVAAIMVPVSGWPNSHGS